MQKKQSTLLPPVLPAARKVPQIVNAKLDRELRKEYNVFVKSVEDLNDKLAYKVFESLALGSTQEKRLLSLHIRRKSNDEKKHWLRVGHKRSQSVETLPPLESKQDEIKSEIRYNREKMESTVAMLATGRQPVATGDVGNEIQTMTLGRTVFPVSKEGAQVKVDRLLKLGGMLARHEKKEVGHLLNARVSKEPIYQQP